MFVKPTRDLLRKSVEIRAITQTERKCPFALMQLADLNYLKRDKSKPRKAVRLVSCKLIVLLVFYEKPSHFLDWKPAPI